MKGRVYFLRNMLTEEVFYVGSTFKSLSERLLNHKNALNNSLKKNRPVYLYMNEIGFENVEICLHYKGEFETEEDLRKQEGATIKQFLDDGIELTNIMIPGRTRSEYYLDNRETICDRTNQFRLENPDIIRERKQKYYYENIEAISDKNKERYEENKEVVKKRSAEYYDNNKEKVLERMLKVNTCECGEQVQHCNMKRHLTTRKHKNKLSGYEIAPKNILCECGQTISRKNIATHRTSKKHQDNMNEYESCE
jgi:hypothetical protein